MEKLAQQEKDIEVKDDEIAKLNKKVKKLQLKHKNKAQVCCAGDLETLSCECCLYAKINEIRSNMFNNAIIDEVDSEVYNGVNLN